MVVTFLKLNIFLFGFFLTASTFSETSKNEVYLLKTNFWGGHYLPPFKTKMKIIFDDSVLNGGGVVTPQKLVFTQ